MYPWKNEEKKSVNSVISLYKNIKCINYFISAIIIPHECALRPSEQNSLLLLKFSQFVVFTNDIIRDRDILFQFVGQIKCRLKLVIQKFQLFVNWGFTISLFIIIIIIIIRGRMYLQNFSQYHFVEKKSFSVLLREHSHLISGFHFVFRNSWWIWIVCFSIICVLDSFYFFSSYIYPSSSLSLSLSLSLS